MRSRRSAGTRAAPRASASASPTSARTPRATSASATCSRSQFTLIKAPVKPFYVKGHPCLRLPILKGQKQGFIKVRIARTAHGKVVNTAQVKSLASGTRRNTASVRVLPARAAGGGVTG